MYFRNMKIVAFPFIDVFLSPIGKIVIKATKTHIHQIYFDDEFSSMMSESALTQKTKQQLTAGSAEKDGTLRPGDIIALIDGFPVVGMTAQVIQTHT